MSDAISRRPLYWLALLIVIGAALWFRFQNLGTHPFWLDEGYSAYGAEKGFDFIFRILPGYETHPPFYTALLRCWTLIAGTSILGFRLLAAFAGVLTLPLIALAAYEAGRASGRSPALVVMAALALAAVIPAIVDVTRLVRPYALIAMVLAGGIWAALRVARGLREEGRLPRGPWLAYLLAQALLFWLHNLGALYVAGLGLGLLITCGPLRLIRQYPKPFFLGHIAVLLIALPAFLILLDQAPTWTKSTWLSFNPDTLPDKLMLIYGLPGLGGLVCAAALAGFAMWRGGRTVAALAVIAIIPILLSLALTLTIAPVFLPRTLVGVGVPFVLLIAVGAASPSLMPRAAFAMLLLLTVMRLIAIQSLPPAENWYGATTWLKARVQPGDMIYAYPNEGALPLHYALRERGIDLPIRPIPQAVPSQDPTGWYPTGSRGVVSLPQYRLEQIAGDSISQHVPTIWLLRLGPAKYDPGDGFVKALSRTRKPVGLWHQEPIHIIGLRR
jgi:mannosyltransferase